MEWMMPYAVGFVFLYQISLLTTDMATGQPIVYNPSLKLSSQVILYCVKLERKANCEMQVYALFPPSS